MTNMTLADIDTGFEQHPYPATARGHATFKSVLVGVDGTCTGRNASALAQRLRDPDGRLTLAHERRPAAGPPVNTLLYIPGDVAGDKRVLR